MKSLIVFAALLSPLFSAFATNLSSASTSSFVENSSISVTDAPSLDINASSVSESTPKNQSSMLIYLIPAGAVLLGIICLIALSKRLLFEKP